MKFHHACLLPFIAPPTITSSSTVVFTNEGGTAFLHCIAQGRPHPQIHWYHGNSAISSPTLHYGPLHNGTLVVYQASSGVGGAYTCEVENAAGKVEASMLLVVTLNLS